MDFTGQVAIVTGAGNGLGKEYALEFARRGAKVVVNDLGGGIDGSGTSDAAQQVVEEIAAMGGEAMANGASVADFEQMQDMVAKARERWGGVHVLVNNAGVLRDKSFAKMDMADFEFVLRVHLFGSAYTAKAVWEIMREQNYGRILMTTSASGLFGNFGQANYAAAKAGIVGLAKTLHLEGAKYDIRVNAIAPLAATRMTEDILPEAIFRQFAPENVVPAAVFLTGRDAPSNAIVGAGAGGFHCSWMTMNTPVVLPEGARSAEDFARAWSRISAHQGDNVPASGMEQSERVLKALKARPSADRS